MQTKTLMVMTLDFWFSTVVKPERWKVDDRTNVNSIGNADTDTKHAIWGWNIGVLISGGIIPFWKWTTTVLYLYIKMR